MSLLTDSFEANKQPLFEGLHTVGNRRASLSAYFFLGLDVVDIGFTSQALDKTGIIELLALFYDVWTSLQPCPVKEIVADVTEIYNKCAN